MIEAGVVALVTADSGITALIGSRMFPVYIPESAIYPCLGYKVVSSVVRYTIEGKEYGQKRFQFDCLAENYSDAENLKQALRNVLTAYSGTLTDGTRILGAFREVEIDLFEPNSGVSGIPGIYRRICDYSFQYVET